MSASPIRTLVARHVCACRPAAAPRALTRTRFLSCTTHRSITYNSPASYGSPEDLRRRYRPDPSSVVDAKQERAQAFRRMKRATYGIILSTLAILGTVYVYAESQDKEKNTVKLDAPAIPGGGAVDATTIADQTEQIPTGTSTIPFFPRTIHLSTSTTTTQDPQTTAPSAPSGGTPPLPAAVTHGDTEYHLLGLGVRTVSILSIQVYVVGLYIAEPDIAILQQRLIRQIDDVATTLVPNEKKKLHDLLLDPVRGEDVFIELVKDAGLRTAFRIVPTRNTDWMHMRDGFVRGISARSAHFSQDLKDPSFTDQSFGEAINAFKAVFGGGARRKIPWGETLYLLRDAKGVFSAVHEDQNGTRLMMGEVSDERVSRLLWLGYLAGKTVSSEPARKSVIEGCVEVCGRPVGTAGTERVV